ncbi:MAG: DNA gyrase inhibitor YacG [Magnetospirillum sp. WYHS-4]
MTDTPAKVVSLKPRKCPLCGKPVDVAFKPFCSKRCADIDLGRWLSEGYRVQTDESPEIPDLSDGEEGNESRVMRRESED